MPERITKEVIARFSEDRERQTERYARLGEMGCRRHIRLPVRSDACPAAGWGVCRL